MALRVLLADESSTIKKVFQLALQDFAVEVRPVNVGVDVVPVAQTFKPDIIFADVLLQKKSGYDVALEIKQTPALSKVPVVLMWSGFMELDEDKFQACKADAQLEKPFDVSALRKLVTELVPRTQNQRLSQFLSFPKMPDMSEEKTTVPPGGGDLETLPAQEEDFQQIPIPKMKSAQSEKFRLNLKPEELDENHVPVDYEMPSEKIDVAGMPKAPPAAQAKAPAPAKPAAPVKAAPAEEEVEEFSIRETRRAPKANPPREETGDLELEEMVEESMPAPAAAAPSAAPAVSGALSAEQLEKIIREQSAEVIESVVWKVIPELAAQIIERELNKLLKERDSHPY